MTDELGPAVTVLQRKLDEQLQAVADTKRTINMLMKMSGLDAIYPEGDGERSGSVRADQFYGKGLATSAAEYLAMRQQAAQADEIFRGLKAGGFDFDLLGWKEEDRVRSLAMSLAKNTGGAGKFHRLKNGSFGLRAWYDEDFLKKAAAASESAAKAKKKSTGTTKAKTAKAQVAPKPVQAEAKPTGNKAHAKSAPVAQRKSSAKTMNRPAAESAVQEMKESA